MYMVTRERQSALFYYSETFCLIETESGSHTVNGKTPDDGSNDHNSWTTKDWPSSAIFIIDDSTTRCIFECFIWFKYNYTLKLLKTSYIHLIFQFHHVCTTIVFSNLHLSQAAFFITAMLLAIGCWHSPSLRDFVNSALTLRLLSWPANPYLLPLFVVPRQPSSRPVDEVARARHFIRITRKPSLSST